MGGFPMGRTANQANLAARNGLENRIDNIQTQGFSGKCQGYLKASWNGTKSQRLSISPDSSTMAISLSVRP
jgi:hypothetical protein